MVEEGEENHRAMVVGGLFRLGAVEVVREHFRGVTRGQMVG
jgi:hypothetical protein